MLDRDRFPHTLYVTLPDDGEPVFLAEPTLDEVTEGVLVATYYLSHVASAAVTLEELD